MPDYTHKPLLVVTAADQDRANAAAAQITGLAADLQTFTVGLSPTGNAPATHYWCAPVMDDAVYAQVTALWQAQFPAAVLRDWDMDADPGLPQRVLAELGLAVVSEGT